MARPDTSSPCPSGPAAAYGWMIPRSTPAALAGSGASPAGYRATGTSAVTSAYSRPPSNPSVTDRTCPAGYGISRSSRTVSGGQPRATGIRSFRPSSVNVP